MRQTLFHIADDGVTIEKCRKHNDKCKKKHWAEAEHVAVHLDNNAYRAEVATKVAEFEALSRNFQHPSTSEQNSPPRHLTIPSATLAIRSKHTLPSTAPSQATSTAQCAGTSITSPPPTSA